MNPSFKVFTLSFYRQQRVHRSDIIFPIKLKPLPPSHHDYRRSVNKMSGVHSITISCPLSSKPYFPPCSIAINLHLTLSHHIAREFSFPQILVNLHYSGVRDLTNYKYTMGLKKMQFTKCQTMTDFSVQTMTVYSSWGTSCRESEESERKVMQLLI